MLAIRTANAASSKAHQDLLSAVIDAGARPSAFTNDNSAVVLAELTTSIQALTAEMRNVPQTTIDLLISPLPHGHGLVDAIQALNASITAILIDGAANTANVARLIASGDRATANVLQLTTDLGTVNTTVDRIHQQVAALHNRLVTVETAPAQRTDQATPTYAEATAGQAQRGIGGGVRGIARGRGAGH
jgi:hypothetical protein